MDEQKLIAAVLRVRVQRDMTAKEVHAALTQEGITASFSDVKKACSKATKQVAQTAAPVAAAPAATAPSEKAAAKAAKAQLSTMKAAEVSILQFQPRTIMFRVYAC